MAGKMARRFSPPSEGSSVVGTPKERQDLVNELVRSEQTKRASFNFSFGRVGCTQALRLPLTWKSAKHAGCWIQVRELSGSFTSERPPALHVVALEAAGRPLDAAGQPGHQGLT
jgi:hypothetical protein